MKTTIYVIAICAAMYAGCTLSPETVEMITDAAGGAAGKAGESVVPGSGYAVAGVATWAVGRLLEWGGKKGYVTIKKKEGK